MTPHGVTESKWPRLVWILFHDALKALLIYLILFILHLYVQHRPLGEYFRNLEHALLQQQMAAEFVATDALHPKNSLLPIVIDISPFRLDKSKPTDRNRLDELVGTLAEMNAAAIGVDIDFSPYDNGAFVTPADPLLFQKWKHYGNVRVGVSRREGQPRNSWLGHLEFRSLAAGMTLPDDSQYAFYWSSPYPLRTAEDYLPQMPAALYTILHPGEPRPSLTESVRVVDNKLAFGAFPVDYSALDRIRKIRYRQRGDLDLSGADIYHRVVLIGDLGDASDFRCNAYRRDPVPGVLIHACAFATLNQGMLWEISEATSEKLDLGLLVCVVLFMATVRCSFAFVPSLRELGARLVLNCHQAEILYFATTAFAILAGCYLFIQIKRLFWSDFLWIAAGLFLHPYLSEVSGIPLRAAKVVLSPVSVDRGSSDVH